MSFLTSVNKLMFSAFSLLLLSNTTFAQAEAPAQADQAPGEVFPIPEMVTDAEAFAMTRRMAVEEGLLVGGSCGMAVEGAVRVADEDHDKLVVVILPDSGKNYLSKIFNEEWLTANGFDV